MDLVTYDKYFDKFYKEIYATAYIKNGYTDRRESVL